MPDAASSSRNTSILLSSHVRLGTWQVFHPPATELGLNNGTGAGQAVVDVDPAGLHADRGECLSLGGEVLRVGGAVRVSGEHGHRMTVAVEQPSPGIFSRAGLVGISAVGEPSAADEPAAGLSVSRS